MFHGRSSSGSGCANGDKDPRRRATRHKTESLSCDLGRVVDLSTQGMRVACTGKPPLQTGQSGKVKLRIPEGAIAVMGRAVWSRRTGFRKYEMGLEFLNVKRSVQLALESIARFGFLGVGAGSGGGGAADEEPAVVRATIDLPDYYAVLGVASHATDDEIRDAFRQLARQYHPDVSKDPNSAERFIAVQEAYEFLKDPKRRRTYDLQMSA
jgi:hypothetical protein